MFDYHCNCCGLDFFFEEGYNANEDAIICPMCMAVRYGAEDNYIIEEVG